MKPIIKHKLKIYSGEEIEIRQTADGEFICPVCGAILGKNCPPWWNSQPVLANGSLDESTAFGSSDICGICNVEYGCDDIPDENQSLTAKWRELREAWLQSIGPDSPFAKQQLENLRGD